jgi:excisionase family DNA binding protein
MNEQIPLTVPIDVVAERLGVSPWTVRTWVRTGRIPYYKVGRRVLVRVTDIEALLAAHYTPATRPAAPTSNGHADTSKPSLRSTPAARSKPRRHAARRGDPRE